MHISGYRNIIDETFEFGDSVNIIRGENAQGKTNILEAMWFFSALKSFRTSKDKDCINLESDTARLELSYNAYGRNNQSVILLSRNDKKKIRKNGIHINKVSNMIGSFTAVLFSPEHLSLIKDGAAFRRKFVDFAICQLRPRYASLLAQYNKTLAHRNSALKQSAFKSGSADMLEVWDIKLSELASVIINLRHTYIKQLASAAQKAHEDISGGRERLSVDYKWSGDFEPTSREDVNRFLLERLAATRQQELRLGSTLLGPHRDDLSVIVNGLSARSFCSQGQQRSCVLSLKTAEAELVFKEYGEYPLLLFDDVLSELDSLRQQYILSKIVGKQVVITCCEQDKLSELPGARTFSINNGKRV